MSTPASSESTIPTGCPAEPTPLSQATRDAVEACLKEAIIVRATIVGAIPQDGSSREDGWTSEWHVAAKDRAAAAIRAATNDGKHITQSVSAVVGDPSEPCDSAPWVCIRTPKDEDVIAVGNSAAYGPATCVIQSSVALPPKKIRRRIAVAYANAASAGAPEDFRWGHGDLALQVIARMVECAKRGALSRAMLIAAELGVCAETDPRADDAFASVMPFVSESDRQLYEMRARPPSVPATTPAWQCKTSRAMGASARQPAVSVCVHNNVRRTSSGHLGDYTGAIDIDHGGLSSDKSRTAATLHAVGGMGVVALSDRASTPVSVAAAKAAVLSGSSGGSGGFAVRCVYVRDIGR
jgi:hypothetical protein